MKNATTRTLFFPLAVLAALGCGEDAPAPEVGALTGLIEQLTAFEAAAQSAPSNTSGISGVTLRVFCGDPTTCPDANTQMVDEEFRGHHQRLLELAQAGDRDDATLRFFRENRRPALPQLRYFARSLPDDSTSESAWHGRVVVWDTERGEWLGAVRVDLERGRVPQHAYAYFDAQGHQVGGAFHDAEADARSANFRFDRLLPRAFETAIETGRDISRMDQVTRQQPHDLGVTLAENAVIIGGALRGALSAYSDGAFVELGIGQVIDLWASGDGFAYRHPDDVRDEGEPSLLRVEAGRVEDLTYLSDLSFHEISSVGERHDLWLRLNGGEGVAEVARWEDGDWAFIDLADLRPAVGRVVAAEQTGDVLGLLTTGPDGPALHLREGEEWTTITLPRSTVTGLVFEPTSAALVASTDGLLRVDLASQEVTHLTSRPVSRLFPSPRGAWFTDRRGPLDPVNFYRVEGSRTVPERALRSPSIDDIAVGADGTIASLSRGVIRRRDPNGHVLRIPAEGTIPGTTATMDIEVDGHGVIWVASTEGLFIGTDEGLHTLTAPMVPAARGPLGEVCILGSGPELSANDLRRVESAGP